MDTGNGAPGGQIPVAQLAYEPPTIGGAFRGGCALLKARPGPLILMSLVFGLLSGIAILNFIVMGGFLMAVVWLRRGYAVGVNNLFDHFNRAAPLIILGLILTGVTLAVLFVFGAIGFAISFPTLRVILHTQPADGFPLVPVLGLAGVFVAILLATIAISAVFMPAYLLIVERRMDAVPAMKESWRITEGVRWKLAAFTLAMFGVFFPLIIIPLIGYAVAICLYLPILYGGYAYFWDAIKDR